MTVINNDFYSLRHVLLHFLSVFAMNHCNSNGLQWGFSDGLLLPCMVELLARGVDILLGQEHEIYRTGARNLVSYQTFQHLTLTSTCKPSGVHYH